MAKARRAKKSKIHKKLLIVPLLLAGVSVSALGINAKHESKTLSQVVGSEVKTYEASNFFKDVFTQNEIKYLPIVYTHPYVDREQVTKADIENELRKSGLTVKSISSETISTGTKVETTNGYTYTVLIYGDVNSDGLVNVLDALDIIEQLLLNEGEGLTGISRIAANVDNEKINRIDVNDVLRIVDFIVGEKPIIDTLPMSDRENDKEAPVINLKGEKEITVKVGEKYVDPGLAGLEITDNLDPAIETKLQIDTSRVFTEIPGKYIVTYNVTDASGNKAKEVTRVVNVVDYVTDIEITMWPNQKYFDGEKISLDGLVAYEILAYGKKQDTPIALDEIKLHPDTPKEAKMGMTEIKVVYKDVVKSIPIKVDENKPIVTLNGEEEVNIKIGDTYTEEGATAKDINGPLEVTTVIKDKNGNIVDKIETTAETTYTIEYSATSLGKTTTEIRKVNIVDFIESVKIESVDANKFQTKYIDGEAIKLDGIIAKATWHTGKETVVETSDLVADIDKAEYDRKNTKPVYTKDLRVKCKIKDPVTGIVEEKELVSTEKITIEIVKKLETIEHTQDSSTLDIVDTGEIYKELWVARVKAGDNEEAIKKDYVKLNAKYVNGEGTIGIAEVWAEDVSGEDAIDIKFKAKKKGNYVIEIAPDTSRYSDYDMKYVKPLKLNPVSTTLSEYINCIEVGDFIPEDASKDANMFKTGDTRIATLDLKHEYEPDVFGDVDKTTYNDLKNKITVKIEKVETVGSEVKYTVLDGLEYELTVEGGYKALDYQTRPITGIRIKAVDDSKFTDDGVNIRVKVIVDNTPDETLNDDYQDSNLATVYKKSRYEVQVGETGKDNITLSLRPYSSSNSNGYEIKQFVNGGKYYTLIPVTLDDQYSKAKNEHLKIESSMLSTNMSDITQGEYNKFVIQNSANANDSSANEYLEVIGVKGSGNNLSPANAGEEVTYIGIAIKDADRTTELENGWVKIYCGDTNSEILKLEPIEIKRLAVSSIKANTTNYNNDGYCYKSIKTAVLTSGTGQDKLEIADIAGFRVKEEKGTPKNITKMGTYAETGEDFGIIKEYKGGITNSGEIEISFWAKNPGEYTITPYINENAINVNDSIVVTVTENTTINKIAFSPDASNPDGKVNVEANAKTRTRFDIKFYHVYEENEQDKRPIDKAPYDLISFEKAAGSVADANWSIGAEFGRTIFDEGKAPADAYVESVRVDLKSQIEPGDRMQFYIKLKKADGTYEYYPNKDKGEAPITILATEAAVPTNVSVGYSNSLVENITIYANKPVAENIVKTDRVSGGEIYTLDDTNKTKIYYETGTNRYYTLLPIKFVDANKGNVEAFSDTLILTNMNTSQDNKNNSNTVSFIDNINDSEDILLSGVSYIENQGFWQNTSDSTVPVTGNEILSYIGIGLKNASTADGEEDLDGNKVHLTEIKVSYSANGTANLDKTLKVTVQK